MLESNTKRKDGRKNLELQDLCKINLKNSNCKGYEEELY